MQSSNLNETCRWWVNCFATRWIILAVGLGAMVCPSQALAWTGQPLAYVTSSNGIAVIDTGDNKVVDTIPASSSSVAVAPDGKHLYVFGPSTSDFVFNISVIDATNGSVVASIPLDVSLVEGGLSLKNNSGALAVTPDGKHLYATTGLCSSNSSSCDTPEAVYFAAWQIDVATNKAVFAYQGNGKVDGIAITPDGQSVYLTNFNPYFDIPQVLLFGTASVISLPGFGVASGIAITPDGRHAYVPYVAFFDESFFSENVPIIDTATNTVVQTVLVGTQPMGSTYTAVAVTPDGKYVYITSQGNSGVTVIDTASNTIVNTILVGSIPSGVAVTPDGRHVYVTNQGSNSVSVIETASNTVVATVPVPGPGGVSIIPPPQGVPFLSFDAKLEIHLGRNPSQDAFNLGSSFILSNAAGNGIHPDTEPVKLQVGPFIATIRPGSFRRRENRSYIFAGVIDGVRLEAKIEGRGGFLYAFQAQAQGVNLGGTTNPVQVSVGIGGGAGLISVKAHFDRDHQGYNHWADYWRTPSNWQSPAHF